MKEHQHPYWHAPQAPDLYKESNKQRERLSSLHKNSNRQYEEDKEYRRLKKAHGDPANEYPGA